MKVALLFPGQGSQYPGMCSSMLSKFPYVRQLYAEANEVLGCDILELSLNGPEATLNLTEYAQPAILLTSFSAFQVLRTEYDIKPTVLAGHSLGEISALCCSGAIAFADALKIVRKRGQLMQEAAGTGTGAMMAVNGLVIEEVESLLKSKEYGERAVISNINSLTQIVVSGEREAILSFGRDVRKMGAVAIPLKVSAPFHSPTMKPAAIAFENELMGYRFTRLGFPVVSNVTGKPYQSEKDIVPLLVQQMTSPVNWVTISSYLDRTCSDATIELPPGKTLTKLHPTPKMNYGYEHVL